MTHINRVYQVPPGYFRSKQNTKWCRFITKTLNLIYLNLKCQESCKWKKRWQTLHVLHKQKQEPQKLRVTQSAHLPRNYRLDPGQCQHLLVKLQWGERCLQSAFVQHLTSLPHSPGLKPKREEFQHRVCNTRGEVDTKVMFSEIIIINHANHQMYSSQITHINAEESHLKGAIPARSRRQMQENETLEK